MRKRITVFLVIGIICFLSGIIMAIFHVSPIVIPVTMVAFGVTAITLYIFTRGGTIIRDEMVIRVDELSGYYSWLVTIYCIFALSIIQYFYPLLMKDWLLWIIMMIMSLSFTLIRFYLLKGGKTD